LTLVCASVHAGTTRRASPIAGDVGSARNGTIAPSASAATSATGNDNSATVYADGLLVTQAQANAAPSRPRPPTTRVNETITETPLSRALSDSGITPLKANIQITGEQSSTTIFGRLGTEGMPCPCANSLPCDCAGNTVRIVMPDPSVVVLGPAPKPKPVAIVRTGVYGSPSVNKCILNNNCTRELLESMKNEVLPKNLIRGRLRRANPLSDHPKKLIKPESYISPVIDPPRPPPPPPPTVAPMPIVAPEPVKPVHHGDPREASLPPLMRSSAPFPASTREVNSTFSDPIDKEVLHMLDQIHQIRQLPRV